MPRTLHFDGERFGLPGCVMRATIHCDSMDADVTGFPEEMPLSLRTAIGDWWWVSGCADAVEKYERLERATKEDEAQHEL